MIISIQVTCRRVLYLQLKESERRHRDILLFQTRLVYGCVRGMSGKGERKRRRRWTVTRGKVQNAPVFLPNVLAANIPRFSANKSL